MQNEPILPALQLTSACNKRCDACLRPPEDRDHRLGWNDVLAYVGDLRTLAAHRPIAYQFVTGGEPTIWRDGDQDIVDVLAVLQGSGIIETLVMASNGWAFRTVEGAEDFVRRVSSRVSQPIGIGVSVARFQENLDDSGCAELENLMGACRDPSSKVVPIALVTLAVDDETSQRVTARYPKVLQRTTALAPLGAAAQKRDDCPSLSPVGCDKTPLGAFLPHFRKDCAAKLGVSREDFDRTPNAQLVDRLSLHNNCGRSPFVDAAWHYCLPLIEEESLSLFAVGEADPETLANEVTARPLLRSLRDRGVVGTLEAVRSRLSQPWRDRLDELFAPECRWPVAYRGCMLCKEMCSRVPLAELDRALGQARDG